MRALLLLAASGAVAIAGGCGGTATTATAGNGGAGASGSSSSDKSSSRAATGTGGSGSGGSASSATTGASASGTSSSSASSNASTSSSSSGGALCPDELGAYMVALSGAGCGDLASSAPQCIVAGAGACQVQLLSQGPAGSALDGTVDLDMSGDFANGAVTEGTSNRTGCTGTWNAAMSQLTVDCGGVGSSQSCIATLTRTGNTCSFGSSSASTSSGSAPCPDEIGAYMVSVTGAGCGDLASSAPQCIVAGTSACQVELVSQGSGSSALNGTVDLDMSGNFANGAVTEGTVNRTGCTGTWNASGSQLTVDCGGVGSSQSCIATLTRTGNTCP